MLALQPRLSARGAAAGTLRQQCCLCRAERAPQAAASSRSGAGERGPHEEQELVLLLERRGDGWGEEVLPHISLVRRPARRRDKRRDNGSVHLLLSSCGLTSDAVTDVVARATAWRVRARLCRFGARVGPHPRDISETLAPLDAATAPDTRLCVQKPYTRPLPAAGSCWIGANSSRFSAMVSAW